MKNSNPAAARQHPQQRQLAILAEQFQWPVDRPDAPCSSWGWGIASEHLLMTAIPDEAEVILEIGSLLGASARFFATHWPSAHVVCIDPWTDIAADSDRPFLKRVPQLSSFLSGRVNGLYDVFLASNWGFRHCMTAVRGFSPDRLMTVYEAGVSPAAVYIDGSHAYEAVLADLVAIRELFPAAVICGDDWSWPEVRQAVNEFCDLHYFHIETAANTWVIHGDRPQERS